METIAVYLFTGFMDSGKTTLIKETLVENGFGIGGKNLIIVCEDGDEEFDKEEMAAFKQKHVGCCDGHSTERTIALIES